MRSSYIVTLGLLLIQLGGGQECNTVGLCRGESVYIGDGGTYGDCVGLCQSMQEAGCTAFTYDTADTLCLLYTDCSSIDEDCDSCISGNVGCDTRFCSVSGSCQGQVLAEGEQESAVACAEFCAGEAGCRSNRSDKMRNRDKKTPPALCSAAYPGQRSRYCCGLRAERGQ